MRKGVVLLLIFLFITPLVAIQPLTVKAQTTTLIVPYQYPTIQSAIGNASSGNIIYVKSGIYYESQLNITKSIKIMGEGANNTKIINIDKLEWEPTLNPFPPPFPKIIHITADNVQVTGFTLSCEYSRWAPIDINANNVIANGNIFGKTGSTVVNGNNNAVIRNLFTKDVAGPFIGCSGFNNTIASNVMIRESEIANAYLNIKGESNLIYNNTMKNCIIEVSGYKNMIINNNFTNSGLVINKDSFNCTISNQRIDFISLMGFYNTFYENEIYGMEIGGTHGSADAANNSFYRNNFVVLPPEIGISTETPGNLIWDNGAVGNYWTGYRGSDTNNDGIGDLPYNVTAGYKYFDGAVREEAIIDCGKDNFPFMTPFDIDNITIDLPEWANTSLNASPSPTVTPSPPTDRNAPHLDPIYYLLPIGIIVAVVVLSVLLFRRHQKTANLGK